jgi:phosphoribosyl 1,2-cyclic phosphate phosphodiesterase
MGIKEQYSYAFTETDYPYLPKMNFIRLTNNQFWFPNKQKDSEDDLDVQPITVMHATMPVLGFRFGKDFTYITDAKTIAAEERDKIRGTKILVVNALRPEQHYSHFTIDEALELVNDVKPELAYFIHMSHQFGLHEETEKKLPANVHVAYDGLKIRI